MKVSQRDGRFCWIPDVQSMTTGVITIMARFREENFLHTTDRPLLPTEFWIGQPRALNYFPVTSGVEEQHQNHYSFSSQVPTKLLNLCNPSTYIRIQRHTKPCFPVYGHRQAHGRTNMS